jgi:probable phosphoglycerate mutase
VRLFAAALGFALLLVPQHENVLRLYLARHGETDWNRDRKLQGSADIALNETGRRQAVALGQQLRGLHFDAVYSSELRRSRETAAVVHGAAPLVALAGLNERRLGAFEGRPSDEEYERRRQDPDDTLDGGESWSQFDARIQRTLEQLLRRHRSGAILIVGHGGTNQMIVRGLFGLSTERTVSFQQANDELYVSDVTEGKATRFWKLINLAR